MCVLLCVHVKFQWKTDNKITKFFFKNPFIRVNSVYSALSPPLSPWQSQPCVVDRLSNMIPNLQMQ